MAQLKADRQTRPPAAALPSPSWTFELLLGQSPGARLPGWPQMYQQHLGEPDAEQIWETYQAALCALARAHGFEPAYLTGSTPTTAGAQRWATRFIEQHRY